MNCPNCKSDQTARLQAIYEAGTSETSMSGYTLRGTGGFFTGSGVSQTLAAQKAAPPEMKSALVPIVFFILFGLISLSFLVLGEPMIVYILGGVWLAVFLPIFYGIWKYNAHIWPGAYQAWLQCWLCSKCGTLYNPEFKKAKESK